MIYIYILLVCYHYFKYGFSGKTLAVYPKALCKLVLMCPWATACTHSQADTHLTYLLPSIPDGKIFVLET